MTTRTPESTDDDSAAAPRPLPYLPDDIRILGDAEQRGDGLVHDVLMSLRQGRLREYAPACVAERADKGRLVPIAGHEAAWADGCARFLDQAQRLYAATPAAAPRIWRVGDMASGAWTIAAPTPPPLSATLADGPALAPAEIIRIAHSLAETLAELHAIGVTHLDICPGTVVAAQGQVTLIDFAVDNRAFLAVRGDTAGLVRRGYSPIEMYDGGRAEPLGPTTDIYAAAALILRLMTGHEPPPWQDRWHDTGPLPIPVSAVDYPPAFVAAIRHALAIEPGQRFADAWSWRQAMGEATPVTVDPGPTATTYPEPAPQPEPWPTQIAAPAPAADRGWMLVAIVALLGLGVLVATYFALRQPGESAAEAAVQYVVTGPANVRSGPSPSDPVIARLAAGERVTGVMTSSSSGERWLRISEGVHAGHYIWAGNLTLAGATPVAGTPTIEPAKAAPPPSLDLSARFAHDNDGNCRFHPEIDAALDNMVIYDSTGRGVARAVAIAGMRFTPSVTNTEISSDPDMGFNMDATIRLGDTVRWNGLRVIHLVRGSEYEDGMGGIVFAEDVPTVRGKLAQMGVSVPLPRDHLELPADVCSASIWLERRNGGTALLCGSGC